MEKLIQSLIDEGVLRTEGIISAFRIVDRKDFVVQGEENHAYEDRPLSIGYEQTISQPYTVAFMLELLNPQRGQTILDVGSGSGWTTALLASIVGSQGSVCGVEIIPELVDFGSSNLAKYHFQHARISQAGKIIGLRERAPFDRILVSAASQIVPTELLAQLTIGGVMVIPIKDTIVKLTKVSKTVIKDEVYKGFAFVPLV